MTPDGALDVYGVIQRHYDTSSHAYHTLITHSELVARKALALIEGSDLDEAIDRVFVYEAAMLHDIGIIGVKASNIGCEGKADYLCHGPIGREMLEAEGLHRHALVCERHTGVGIEMRDIMREGLPLPLRPMVPVSVEEKAVCFADTFFSKNPKRLTEEKPFDKARASIARFGDDKLARFDTMARLFAIA